MSTALRHYKIISQAGRENGSPVSVMNLNGRSSTDDNNNKVTRLTRYLFTEKG